MQSLLLKTKMEKILTHFPKTIFIINPELNIISIDNVEYIEKRTIYKTTSLSIVEVKNILNNTSALIKCLDNRELRTIKIKNSERNYILYNLEDIKKIDEFKKHKLHLTTYVVAN